MLNLPILWIMTWNILVWFFKLENLKKRISDIKVMANGNDTNALAERDPEELFRLKWNDFTVRMEYPIFIYWGRKVWNYFFKY